MCRLSISIIVVLTVLREGYASCPPIQDSPTARLMYTSSNTIQVLPTSPLEEGTVATLKCHTGLKTSGKTTATCTSGKWIGLPLGECAKE